MDDRSTPPRLPPTPLQAVFKDLASARTAIETMLQGGFTGEQLGMYRPGASLLTPANDLSTYRATDMANSGSPLNMDPPLAGDDADTRSARDRELKALREHAVIVTVTPFDQQEKNAREMLSSLGGRLLRADGSFESTEAA
jgi:hypothetical protein